MLDLKFQNATQQHETTAPSSGDSARQVSDLEDDEHDGVDDSINTKLHNLIGLSRVYI